MILLRPARIRSNGAEFLTVTGMFEIAVVPLKLPTSII
jgi:hypothetical protein